MSRTILVVDDEMLIALDIQIQLEELGHKVLIACGASEAIALLKRQRIDAAIVDWHLRDEISAPITDLSKEQKIPFVLCSGSPLDELAGLFPSAPILLKPFGEQALVYAMSQVADHKEPCLDAG